MENLRALRCKRLGIDEADSERHASMKRLHDLFRRYTNRFKGDVSTWLQWMDFAKANGSTNVLSRCIGRAVLLHPLCVDLWILAAEWEFSHEANINTARALFLKGIRCNDRAQKIWKEYFRMEMLYLNKVLARLQLVTPGTKKDEIVVPVNEEEEDEQEEAEHQFLEDMGKNVDEKYDGAPIEDTPFAKGAVLLAIFRNVCENFPHDFEFCVSFCRLATSLKAPEDLIRQMNDLLAEKWSDRVAFWALRLEPLRDAHDTKAINQLLNEARAKLSGPDFWLLKASSCLDDPQKVVSVCEEAFNANEDCAALCCKWLAVLVKMNELKEAVDVGAKCVEKYVGDEKVWFEYLTARLAWYAVKRSSAQRKELSKEFKRCLQIIVALHQSHLIRSLYVRFLFASPPKNGFDRKIIRIITGDAVLAEFVVDLMSRSKLDVSYLRDLFHTILKVCSSHELFHKVIDWEQNQDMKRELYEDLIARFGAEDVDAWLEYANFEATSGNLESSGRIHWRARKTLVGEHLTKYLERNATE